jgi:hypothetical protein
MSNEDSAAAMLSPKELGQSVVRCTPINRLRVGSLDYVVTTLRKAAGGSNLTTGFLDVLRCDKEFVNAGPIYTL